MSILFADVLNAPRNTSVMSNQFVAPSAGTLSIASVSPAGAACAIVKNGIEVGSSVDYAAADVIALKTVASNQYASAIHVELNHNGDADYWAAVSVDDFTRYVNPELVSLLQVEQTVTEDGTQYFPQAANNRVRVIADVGQSTSASIAIAQPSASISPISDSFVLVCSYYDRRLHAINPVTNELSRTIELEGRPYQVVRVPRDPNEQVKTFDLWVTCVDTGTVVILDAASGSVRETISVGVRPYGIAVSPDGRRVWVAVSGDDKLVRFSYNGSTFVRTDFNVGLKPSYVCADNNQAWVSCTASDKVYAVTNGGTLSQISVGANVHGIALYDGSVYVASLGASALFQITNGEVAGRCDVDAAPIGVYAVNGGVAVVCYSTRNVLKVANNAIVARSQFLEWPTHVIPAGGKLFVTELWAGAPGYMYSHDRDPHPFVIDSPQVLQRGVEYTTNEFVVRGINVEAPISIAPVLGISILRNGVDAGQRSVVSAGDRIALRIAPTDAVDTTIATRLYVGNQGYEFQSRTTDYDLRPKPFELAARLGVEPSSNQASNTITVSGLEEGLDTRLFISAGRLFVNDAQQSSNTAQVGNGDTFRVEINASPSLSTPTFCVVTLGDYETVFSVFTANVAEETNYMETRYAGRTLHNIIDFPTVPTSLIDRSLDKVIRYNKTTFAKLGEVSLTGAAQNNGIADTTLIFAPDPVRRALDLIDLNQAGVETTYQFGGMPYGITTAPMVAMGQLDADHYVTQVGSSEIRQLKGGKTLQLQANANPMGIACSNYNQLFVAGDSGLLYTYNYVESNQSFVFDSIFGIPGGGRLHDILFDDTNMYVTDISDGGKVHCLRSGLYQRTVDVGLLPYSVTQSGTFVYTANFGSSSVSMFPKDASAGGVRTVDLPAGASTPNCIAYDATNGYLYVGCSRVGKVYVLRASTLELIFTISEAGPVWGLQVVSGELLVLNRWGNLLNTLNIGVPRTGPKSIGFDPQVDVLLDDEIVGGPDTVTDRMPRRETVWIEPYSDANLIVNGAEYGTTPTTITTGDVVSVKMRSSYDYLTERSLRLFSFNHNAVLETLTVLDVFPDKINFDTIQNVIVRDRVESNERTVTGLGSGVEIGVLAAYSNGSNIDAGVELYINGLLFVEGTGTPIAGQTHSNRVRNGDTVRVAANAYGVPWNGEQAFVTLSVEEQPDYMFATLRIITGYLDNAIRPPYKLDDFSGMDAFEYAPNNLWTFDEDREVVTLHGRESLVDSPIASLAPTLTRFSADIEFDTQGAATSLEGAAYDWLTENRIYNWADVVAKEAAWVVPSVPSTLDVGYSVDANITNSRYEVGSMSYASAIRSRASQSPTSTYGSTVRTLNYLHTSEYARPLDLSINSYATSFNWRARAFVSLFGTEWQSARRNPLSLNTTWERYVPRSDLSYASVYDVASKSFVQYASSYQRHVQKSQYEYKVSYGKAIGPKALSAPMLFNRHTFNVKRVDAMYVDRRRSRELVVVATYKLDTLNRNRPQVTASYLRYVPTSNKTIGVQYQGRVRASLNRYDSQAVRLQSKTSNHVGVAYQSSKRFVFDDYVYTAPSAREFNTAEAAIAAGVAQTNPIVFAKQLYDTFWMWHIPAVIERVECANTALTARFVRGYVQGG